MTDGRTVLERWADFRDAWCTDDDPGYVDSVAWDVDGYRPLDEYQKQAPRVEASRSNKSGQTRLSIKDAILKKKWDDILRSR